jgi:hypothetical protein
MGKTRGYMGKWVYEEFGGAKGKRVRRVRRVSR